MANFEMEFELSGLKIKVKSERDDAPKALQSVQSQIGNLLQAAAGLGTGEIASGPARPSHSTGNVGEGRTIEAPAISSNSAPARTKATRGKRASTNESATAVEFSHDPAAYGLPKQTWNTAQKSMWLLYVLEKQNGHRDLSTGALASTFNKHFKEFGAITTTNVTRDLGRARAKNGFVSSDASKDPQTWYLLDAGKKEVERLVQVAKTENAS